MALQSAPQVRTFLKVAGWLIEMEMCQNLNFRLVTLSDMSVIRHLWDLYSVVQIDAIFV